MVGTRHRCPGSSASGKGRLCRRAAPCRRRALVPPRGGCRSWTIGHRMRDLSFTTFRGRFPTLPPASGRADGFPSSQTCPIGTHRTSPCLSRSRDPCPFRRRGQFWRGDLRSNTNRARAPEAGAGSEPGYRVQSPRCSFGHPPLGLPMGGAGGNEEPRHPPSPRTGAGEEVGDAPLGVGVLACLVVPWEAEQGEHPHPAPMNPKHPRTLSTHGLALLSEGLRVWKGPRARGELMVFSRDWKGNGEKWKWQQHARGLRGLSPHRLAPPFVRAQMR